MIFAGFTFPDGAYLPPELIHLMPNISGSMLKVIIAILYHSLQFGGGEMLNLADMENYTGLSKRQVIRVLTDLLEYGVIERQAIGQTYVYGPNLRTNDKMSSSYDKMSEVSLRESDRELIKDSLTDSLNLTNLSSDKMSLVQKLRAAGVYLKTAQGIVEKHDGATIERYLKYYRHAMMHNLAQGPGWLVQALKEDWGAPLGWNGDIACGCAACVGSLREAEAYAGWEEI